MSAKVAALFVRADSVYKSMPGVDAWDAERDARGYAGPWPVVAHPPCRAWGRLRALAKPRDDEKDLARFAVDLVRQVGGVLEHPEFSTLWNDKCLPAPGQIDGWGGWCLPLDKFWFGHKARKRTWLYIVGCRPSDLPSMAFCLGESSHVITQGRSVGGARFRKGMPGWRPEVTKAEREHTPPEFAEWLVDLAARCAK